MDNTDAGTRAIYTVKAICIDNIVFKLHYRLTAKLCLIISMILNLAKSLGGRVKCQNDPESMKMHCWVYSSFTVADESGDVKNHLYYEWVCFLLYAQAILFFIPFYIWRKWEGNRVFNLSGEAIFPISDENVRENYKRNISEFFYNSHHHLNSYAFKFFLCEILNFVNVIAQIYLTDYFLDGEFFYYGLDILKYSLTNSEQGVNPMARVFPKTSKCTLRMDGASGTTGLLDVICYLPLNVFNEVIFAVMWIWFFVLAVVTGMSLIWRATVLVRSSIRLSQLRALASLTPPEATEAVFNKCHIGDWFLLCQVGKNIDELVFRDTIMELAERLERKYDVENLRRIKVD